MEDQTVAINDKGFTVLVEPDNPIVELVSLFFYIYILHISAFASLVADLLKYCLHSWIYRPPQGNVDSEELRNVLQKERSGRRRN